MDAIQSPDKKRFEKHLRDALSIDQRKLLGLINIEPRKNKLLFRMPEDVISLDDIWCKILAVGKKLNVSVSKKSIYATVRELDEVLGDIKWLWKDWLPRGFVTMLVGDPGIGKSMLVLSLVDMIINGDPFPTSPNEEKASCVIWVDTEASQQLLRIRSIKMNINRDRLYIPVIDNDILGQVDVLNEEHRAVILEMIDDLNPSLLVIDSLGGSHTRGENKFEDIAPIMQFFANVARDKNIAILMTHHLNKGNPGDTIEVGLYRIRGSTAIPQFSRSIIAMEKLKDDEVRLRMIKSNLSRKAEPLSLVPTLDADGDVVSMEYKEYKAPPAKRTKTESCSAWVLSFLKNHPEGIRIKDLIDYGEPEGYTKGNIYSARSILADNILVKGNGRESYWSLNVSEPDTTSINKIMNAKKNGGKDVSKEK